MKPEQASKVAMRKPTRLCNGEGRAERGSEPVHAPDLFRRGSGHSTLARQCGLSGEARTGGVCHPERHSRWRLDRASDRFVVPLRPGNSIYDKVWREDILEHAYELACENDGQRAWTG